MAPTVAVAAAVGGRLAPTAAAADRLALTVAAAVGAAEAGN